MGGVYDNWQMQSHDIIGPVPMVDCPRCGAPAEVLKMPEPNSWFNAFGQARCPDCRLLFPIALVEEVDEADHPRD